MSINEAGLKMDDPNILELENINVAQKMTLPVWLVLGATYAVAINFVSFLVFAWDKHRARNGMWRVSERQLLHLAAIGGTLGVVVGQRTLRHKTRKEPFRTYLQLIILIQVVGVAAVSFPQVRNFLWGFVNG